MILKNCSMKTFDRLYRDKNIVCFGAGMMPDDMCKLYEELHLEERIEYVIDNDQSKWGTEINAISKDIPIISPDEFVKNIYRNQVIIITSAFYMEIFEQLNQYKQLSETDCFVFPIMDSMYPNDMKEPFVVPNGEYKIPKVIHYCWFGYSKIPAELQECMNSWKRICPDYEIKRWDESNYDITKITYMKEAYQARKWGFVTDCARLDLVYRYGGICLDTDVELLKSLDELRKFSCFMAFQETPRVNLGCGFGAVKRHPIEKKMFDYYESIPFIDFEGNMNMTPCTVHQTNVLKKLGVSQNGKYQEYENFVILPKEFLCPMSSVTGVMHKTQNTFSVHKSSASWFTETQRKNHINNFENQKDFIDSMIDLELCTVDKQQL